MIGSCNISTTRFLLVSVILLLLASKNVSSFSVVRSSNAERTATKKCISGAGTAIWSSSSAQETSASQEEKPKQQQQQQNAPLNVPSTWNEMVRQASTAMKEAEQDGVTRQIFRVLLPRDASSTDLLRFFEDDKQAVEESPETALLVPPDESWQGGIMQLYRAAVPTANKIVREWTLKDKSAGVPPRLNEDRSVDESGVDGVGLLTTDDSRCTCWIQPTQENCDYLIQTADKAKKDDLVLLLNPQWRQTDDVLDQLSEDDSPFGFLASFLGGKGGTVKRVNAAGFRPVYTFEGYVCRGSNVRLLKAHKSDWHIFCERDDRNEGCVLVGTTPADGPRPTYQQVDDMLTDANIGYKYARDMGLDKSKF